MALSEGLDIFQRLMVVNIRLGLAGEPYRAERRHYETRGLVAVAAHQNGIVAYIAVAGRRADAPFIVLAFLLFFAQSLVTYSILKE